MKKNKDNQEFLNTAIQVALQAGALLRKGFDTTFEITSKPGRHNLVTEYDKAAEDCILTTLMKRFPDHGFIGEEQGHTRQGEVTWIVDPLDGTVNFAHGVPLFCVSIAVAVQEEIVASAVFQPMTQELFWALKDHGAFLNGKPLHVSTNASFQDAFVTTGFPYNVEEDPLHCIETFSSFLRKGIPIRRLGSAAIDMAYVAAGRFDAYWEASLQPWDFAGSLLLIEEAGGTVTQYDGSPCKIFQPSSILATNQHLHAVLQKELQ